MRILAGALAPLTAALPTDAPPPGGLVACPGGPGDARVLRGLAYGPLRPQRADLVLPPRSTYDRTGAVVLLHGGGWDDPAQRRAWVGPVALRLACALGAPVLVPDYRLVREGGAYPENLRDVLLAVAWLRGRAGALAIDPARVAAFGESAGGHLGLLAAARAPLAAAVSFSGATDLPRLAARPAVAASVRAMTRSSCDGREGDPCVAASPVAAACALPPALLVHGGRDHLVPMDQPARLAAAVAACGRAPPEVWSLPDAARARCPPGLSEHGFSPCLLDAAWPRAVAFLRAALAPRR